VSVEDSVSSAALVSKDSVAVISGMGASFAVSTGLFAAVNAMTVAGGMGFLDICGESLLVSDSLERSLLKLRVTSSVDVGTARIVDGT